MTIKLPGGEDYELSITKETLIEIMEALKAELRKVQAENFHLRSAIQAATGVLKKGLEG